MTSWNDAAITELSMSITKANLTIPVSKKTSQSFADVSDALKPFANGFQVTVEYIWELAEAVTVPVREACVQATTKATAKGKGRAAEGEDLSTESVSIPDEFPPATTHPWIRHTVRNLLRNCPKWVLEVRTNESNTIRYAVTFEILSILSHRRKLVTQTVAGAFIRTVFHHELVKYFPGYKFPDGLPDPKPLEESEEIVAKDMKTALSWQQYMSNFASKLAQVPRDFAGLDESDDEMLKEEMQKMLTVNVIDSFLCNTLIPVLQTVVDYFVKKYPLESLKEVKLPQALLLQGQEYVNLLNPQKHKIRVSNLSSVIIH